MGQANDSIEDVMRLFSEVGMAVEYDDQEDEQEADDSVQERPVSRAQWDAEQIAGQLAAGPARSRSGRPTAVVCENPACRKRFVPADRGPVPRWCCRACSPSERHRPASRRRGRQKP